MLTSGIDIPSDIKAVTLNKETNVLNDNGVPHTRDQSRILLVEDDAPIAKLLAEALDRAGYDMSVAQDVKAARMLLSQERPDLIVLDLMLPGESGLDLARSLEDVPDAPPIIMLTALGELGDRLAGFSAGADDYLTKPFSSEELIARIQAVLRRAASTAQTTAHLIYHFDDWEMDVQGRTLKDPNGVEIVVTSAEFDVLATLCSAAGEVQSRDTIVMKSQGRRVEPYDRSVDTLVSRLRQKIEPDPSSPSMIRTVRNGGYVFTPQVTQVRK